MEIPDILPYKAPSKITAAFITGASGQIGGYLAAQLLKEYSDIKLYCLVNADHEAMGREKIIKNLEKYGLWNNSYKDRIVIVLGKVLILFYG
jgi:thioester reductase-like protein